MMASTQPRSAASGEFVNGRRPVGSARRVQKFLNSTNRFRCEEDIPTDGADLGRDMVDDDHSLVPPKGLNDVPDFIIPRTALYAALHGRRLLTSGLTHLGGFGSYTVMITKVGWLVVATM
jgi:hypothetical protein